MLPSAAEFLEANPAKRPSCLMLDVSLPDFCGLDLQAVMTAARVAGAGQFAVCSPVIVRLHCNAVSIADRSASSRFG